MGAKSGNTKAGSGGSGTGGSKGPAGWPSKNPGKPSGGGRDVNPPKKPTTK